MKVINYFIDQFKLFILNVQYVLGFKTSTLVSELELQLKITDNQGLFIDVPNEHIIFESQSLIITPKFLNEYGIKVNHLDIPPQWSATGGRLVTSDDSLIAYFDCKVQGVYRIDILIDADLTPNQKPLLKSIEVEVLPESLKLNQTSS